MVQFVQYDEGKTPYMSTQFGDKYLLPYKFTILQDKEQTHLFRWACSCCFANKERKVIMTQKQKAIDLIATEEHATKVRELAKMKEVPIA